MGDARRHPVRGSSPQVGRHTEHNGRMKVRILPTPLNQIIMKYPRTYHLPYSPGATKDDKKLSVKNGINWFSYYKGKEIVITEKLDGENTCFTRQDVYARSHGAPTRSPWSRNLWDPYDGLYWKVQSKIGSFESMFGENLYGEHSIHYDKLPCYWFMFACYWEDCDYWCSWDDVKMSADILNVPTVPELWRGKITYEEQLKELVDKYVNEPSLFGPKREGVVIRVTKTFRGDEFPHYVCKWVRPNHIQTDVYWTKNWKKAELINI